VIALVWCLIMFFMMPYWHLYGQQNLANEAYRAKPADFAKKADEIIAKHKVR
jgi:cytochrome c oxidase subunit 2